jgi:hypothetical protein
MTRPATISDLEHDIATSKEIKLIREHYSRTVQAADILAARVKEFDESSATLFSGHEAMALLLVYREALAAYEKIRCREWSPTEPAGCRALKEALDLIGKEGATDHMVAKIVCDNELALRKLVAVPCREWSPPGGE